MLGAGNGHQNAQRQPQRDHGRATVAQEGQRQPHHGQDAADHAHVHKSVGKENHRDGGSHQAAKQGGGLQRNGQRPPHQQHKAGDEHEVADQAKFFGEGGKDEVRGALGNKFQVGLRTRHKAFAPDAARADGDHPLDDVKALAQRVAHGVEQGADAGALVVVQKVPTDAIHAQGIAIPNQQHDANGRQQDGGQHQLPGQAGKKDHRQPRGQHQQRGAQVRLLQNQRRRQGQQAKSDDKIAHAGRAFAALEPPGQHQRHGNFQQLRGLNHHAHIHPALCPLFGDAKHQHRNQQRDAQAIQRHGGKHDFLRWHLRHDEQNGRRQQHVAPMVDKARAVVVTRGIHRQQAQAREQGDEQQQHPIEAQEHGHNALQQRRFVKFSRHKRRLSSAENLFTIIEYAHHPFAVPARFSLLPPVV